MVFRCAAGVRSMERNPPSYKSSFFDTLLATLQQLEALKADTDASKEDVVVSMRNHLSVMLQKSLSMPLNTSFCVLHNPTEGDT